MGHLHSGTREVKVSAGDWKAGAGPQGLFKELTTFWVTVPGAPQDSPNSLPTASFQTETQEPMHYTNPHFPSGEMALPHLDRPAD